jgi:hypothetical protein
MSVAVADACQVLAIELAIGLAEHAGTAGNAAKHLDHPAQFLDRRREAHQEEAADHGDRSRNQEGGAERGFPDRHAESDHEHAGAQRHDAEEQQEVKHTLSAHPPSGIVGCRSAESPRDVLKKVRICL